MRWRCSRRKVFKSIPYGKMLNENVSSSEFYLKDDAIHKNTFRKCVCVLGGLLNPAYFPLYFTLVLAKQCSCPVSIARIANQYLPCPCLYCISNEIVSCAWMRSRVQSLLIFSVAPCYLISSIEMWSLCHDILFAGKERGTWKSTPTFKDFQITYFHELTFKSITYTASNIKLYYGALWDSWIRSASFENQCGTLESRSHFAAFGFDCVSCRLRLLFFKLNATPMRIAILCLTSAFTIVVLATGMHGEWIYN